MERTARMRIQQSHEADRNLTKGARTEHALNLFGIVQAFGTGGWPLNWGCKLRQGTPGWLAT